MCPDATFFFFHFFSPGTKKILTYFASFLNALDNVNWSPMWWKNVSYHYWQYIGQSFTQGISEFVMEKLQKRFRSERPTHFFFHFEKFSYTDLEFLPYYLIQRALICNTTKTRSAPKILRSIGSVYLIFSLVSDFFYLIFLQQLGWQLFLDLGGATVSNRANRIKNKMELTDFVLYTTHQIFNIRSVVSVGKFVMLSWFL